MSSIKAVTVDWILINVTYFETVFVKAMFVILRLFCFPLMSMNKPADDGSFSSLLVTVTLSMIKSVVKVPSKVKIEVAINLEPDSKFKVLKVHALVVDDESNTTSL